MRAQAALLSLLLAARPVAALTPDTVAVLAAPAEVTGAAVGLEASTSSTAPSSAGAVGKALGTSGPSWGIRGVAASPDGVAGLFEAAAGGDPLLAVGPTGGVFFVAASGAVEATAFAGDGSSLVGGAALICSKCLDSGDLAAGVINASHLPPNVVTSIAIQDGGVGALEIAAGAIGASELAAGAVDSAAITDRVLGASHVGAFAVTTAKLGAATVTRDELAADSISLPKLAGSGDATALHLQHEDCDPAGALTPAAACSARACAALPLRFLDCSGNCDETTAPLCSNVLVGFLLPDSE